MDGAGLRIDWETPVDVKELLERTKTSKYSLRDAVLLKALAGNEDILMQLLRQTGGGAPRREEIEELEGWLSREAWERRSREDV